MRSQTLDFGALMATPPPPRKHTYTHTHKQNQTKHAIGWNWFQKATSFDSVFSKKKKKKKKSKVPPASLTSREEKLSRTILSLNEKNLFHVPSTPALLLQTMKFCRKRKWTYNRLKRLGMHHVYPFSENFVGEVPGHLPQLQRDIPLLTHTAVSPRGWSLTPSGNGTTFLYIFNANFLKIQLNLSEFKRLYLYSRLHILHHFFKLF